MPTGTPPAGRPLRLAFVGERAAFAPFALAGEAARFFDARPDADALRRELDAFRPHVVVALGARDVPAGAFAGLRAATLGVLTEAAARDDRGRPHKPAAALEQLRGVDVASFDRLLAADPLVAELAAGEAPVWRAAPLPVDDRLFGPVTPIAGRPRILALGASTPWRELMLSNAKLQHEALRHEATDAPGDLAGLLAGHDVGVNVHAADHETFERRVLLHLAAGHLVLSEPLAPLHGLEKDIDVLEIATPGGLAWTLEQLHRFPRAWHRVRVRGRLKAEQFRASRVWPRIAGDLLADLAAFGTARP